MRRSTRVFFPKAKDGEKIVRVLRSGRRLWVDSSDTKHKESPKNGDDWFPMLKLKQQQINGWHGGCHPVHGLTVQDPMDVDEVKQPQPEPVFDCRREGKMFVNVYSRKRKRCNVDESKKFGLHFVRRKKRRNWGGFDGEIKGCGGDDNGVLSVVLDDFCVGCKFFSGLLCCLLRGISKTSVGLVEVYDFLVSTPIFAVFASSGVHFFWNRRPVESKGVCRIFGVSQMTAMFTMDFTAAPDCFQHLYFDMLIRSVHVSCSWLISFPSENENDDTDDEPLPCLNDQSVSSKKNVVSNGVLPRINDRINSTLGIVLALPKVDAKNMKPVKVCSVPVKSCIRNVSTRVGVLTRSSSKRRKRSLRNRKARNPLHLVIQKFSGPPVSNHVSSKKPLVTDHDSPKKNASSLPLATIQDIRRSVRKKSMNEIRVQNPSSPGLNVEIESQCCTGNILVVESDKCYRVEGVEVTLEASSSSEWLLVVKKDGLTRCSFKVQREMRPGATNRFTHACIWTAENGWKLEFPDRKEWIVFKELHKLCEERNIIPMSPIVKNIPIPEVSEVSNLLDFPGAFKRPESYIRMTSDELSRTLSRETANYDMDSEDEEWLSELNSELDASKYVLDESFELMIDAFEKASFCNPEEASDEKAAASLCSHVASGDVAEPVYRYWMKKRKQKCAPLIRVYQLNQPKREPLIQKPVLRKKRSLKRPSALSVQQGRGKDINFLQGITTKQNTVEEHSAVQRVQEAKDTASKSVELAILKRQRAQFLMENADLAMYRATIALRIADVANEISSDYKQAADHFLD